MKLYSYIVAIDSGFSPNPFFGYCTLACCKPAIRRTIDEGDWIVGLSPKAKGNKVIYAMQVDEILKSYSEYYNDERFVNKRPDYTTGKVYKRGDNIYKPLPDGTYEQLLSQHSDGKQENLGVKKWDLNGVRVLVGKTFHYFGASGPELPESLSGLKVGRGHRNAFSPETINYFLEFIAAKPQGVNCHPTKW
jgi:hypothetical protein